MHWVPRHPPVSKHILVFEGMYDQEGLPFRINPPPGAISVLGPEEPLKCPLELYIRLP